MANLSNVLNDHIRRLSRRTLTADTRSARRLLAQHRRDIAALKRQVAQLQKTVSFLEQQEKRRVANPQPAPEAASAPMRFRADGLKSHRRRLGLSANEYGKLLGVSGQSIHNWENGTARPRQAQLASIAGLRGLGKREAMRRLELLG